MVGTKRNLLSPINVGGKRVKRDALPTTDEDDDDDEKDWNVKREPRLGFHRAGFINSGDVLLSRNLEMHYHWGCSVSLPCSEWERVGPLRYDHQKAGEAEASPWGNGGAVSPQLHQKFWGLTFVREPKSERLALGQSPAFDRLLKEQRVL